jgi:hypothetical protein
MYHLVECECSWGKFSRDQELMEALDWASLAGKGVGL